MRKAAILIPLLFTFLLFQNNHAKAQQTHTIILAGYKTAANVKTPDEGSVDVTLKGDSLSVKGSFSNLSDYYFGSAIFYGEKGENGNKIISLNPTIAENRTGGTFEKSKNTFKLTEGQLEALSKGNLYISIMSFEYQRGEIRAQLPAFK